MAKAKEKKDPNKAAPGKAPKGSRGDRLKGLMTAVNTTYGVKVEGGKKVVAPVVTAASAEQALAIRRWPFDVFPLDAASGGGNPCRRIILWSGMESTGKTTMVVKSIRGAQRHCRVCLLDLREPIDSPDAPYCCPHMKPWADLSADRPPPVGTLVSRGKSRKRTPLTEPERLDLLQPWWGAVANLEHGPPIAAFLDSEGTFDVQWAKALGWDPDLVYMALPSFGEQVVDIVDEMIRRQVIEIVAIDSLASMAPAAEIEDSAEKHHVGVAARMCNKAMRKWVAATAAHGISGTITGTTVHLINQIRMKVGQLFGNPETLPGGYGQRFVASMAIRMGSVEYTRDAEHMKMAVQAGMKFTFSKNKTFVPKVTGSLTLNLVTRDGVRKGLTDEVGSVLWYADKYGVVQPIRAGDDKITGYQGLDVEAEDLEDWTDQIVRRGMWAHLRHSTLRAVMESTQ